MEAEKIKNESLEESIRIKDEFLYLISHEFKTPITVISSVIQLIEFTFKSEIPENLDRYLKMIKVNTNRQHRLVNNLLDVMRIKSGRIKIDMNKIDITFITKSILDSVEPYASQKNINIGFKSKIDKNEFYIDEQKYERILLNLLSNALKYSPNGKSINGLLSIEKHKNLDYLRLNVQDEGIGISVENQNLIFERFNQVDTSLSRQAEGSGLGLYLVKSLVDSLGGEISIKSKVAEGSTFTVLLPVIEQLELSDEEADNRDDNLYLGDRNSRITKSVSIEFSDLYYD